MKGKETASATAITGATQSNSAGNSVGDSVRTVSGRDDGATIYYLLWRTRPSHPWHSEEFDNRNRAHQRYFTLIQRGVEAYLECRRRAILPA